MNSILFVILLTGSALADWMISGTCGGYTVNQATIVNGNCSPNGDFYNLVVPNPSRNKIAFKWCTDSACTKCMTLENHPLIPFVDCDTTPSFRYTSKTNPESAVIALLGGTVYGYGNSYDNCTTSWETNYVAANLCSYYPVTGTSQMISCTPGVHTGSVRNYSDMFCKQETDRSTLYVGYGCNVNDQKSFSFCKFQKSNGHGL